MESDHPRFMTQRTPLQIMRRQREPAVIALPGGRCSDSALITVCYLSTPYATEHACINTYSVGHEQHHL